MTVTNPKLGVNIDHVATLRQARGTSYPDILQAALAAELGGADFITVHLREDRRHIQDQDVYRLQKQVRTYLNLELAATEEMKRVALEIAPFAVCVVPERREEITTEGGLDILSNRSRLQDFCCELTEKGIRVALFIEPKLEHIEVAASMGVPAVELHTGAYATAPEDKIEDELRILRLATNQGKELELSVNAGHGLNYENIGYLKQIRGLSDINIGHSIVCKALEIGLTSAVKLMKKKLLG